jgi:hypothetical protein
VHVRQGGLQPAENGLPAGWKVWAARAETAPKTFIDPMHGRSQPGSPAISGDSNSLVYGGWQYAITGVESGKWYRFVAYYRTEAVRDEALESLPEFGGRGRTAKGRVGRTILAQTLAPQFALWPKPMARLPALRQQTDPTST